MTDYAELGHIDFLPELAALDLEGKAQAIQALIEENFFHSSGLFYSILLIDGSHHVRPMARADLVGASVHAENQFNDGGATRQPKDHSTPDQYHAAILGLYRFRDIAAAAERDMITAMLRDIADFLTRRNYQSGWVACCRARRRFSTSSATGADASWGIGDERDRLPGRLAEGDKFP